MINKEFELELLFNAAKGFLDGSIILYDQTTPNMIQDISSIIARKPMIIRKISMSLS